MSSAGRTTKEVPAAARSSASSAPVRDPRATPAMRQYYRFKKEHPECVLFFRMGDFYEMFDEDAITCHKALGITLTERTKGVPMAGVPYHAVDGYLRQMIELGHRVAVCEQVEDPKHAKGVVDRAVTRIITPGTLVDENLLDEGSANLVGAICFTEAGDESAAVLALAELSTGVFTLHEFSAADVVDELARLAPSELLYCETADGSVPARVERARSIVGCSLTPRPSWTFRQSDAGDLLREHYGVQTLTGFGLDEHDPAIAAAGALVRFLQETHQGADDGATCGLSHLRPPRREASDATLIIDAASLRSLEIERTVRSGHTEGSLLATLQRCQTPMGKRLLRRWLCFPLRTRDAIEARQRIVAALVTDRDLADDVVDRLSRVQDVARIAGRIAVARATPRDVVALGRSLAELRGLVEAIEGIAVFSELHQELSSFADALMPLADTIGGHCVDSPPAHLRAGGLFADGVDQQLDEARQMQRHGADFLAKYQSDLIVETKIPSLKVGFNKVFGYYIEVTHAHRSKVPDAFSRKQTLKNAERYITPRLKEFEDRITTAEERAIAREQVLFERLCRRISGHGRAIGAFADAVAQLDVLACFAENAVRGGYVKPEIVDDAVIDIRDGRHPVLDRVLDTQFVPNDCCLGELGDDERAASLALITGPNMAGKSTAIRQVALIVLIAHTGSFVPAREARIGLTDRIFTRIGAHDELHLGQSTFMVEMTETANILHHATERSLVILDEIGRGTSTLDGLSLAWAIAESLSDISCRTLFATHYHELTQLADDRANVRNLHVAVREWGDEIVFLYRIEPGRTDRSYGIHVAKLAGLPSATISRAKSLLETLSVMSEHELSVEASSRSPRDHGQMSLFTEYVDHPVIDELRAIDLDRLSPLEAFDALRRLCETVSGNPGVPAEPGGSGGRHD